MLFACEQLGEQEDKNESDKGGSINLDFITGDYKPNSGEYVSTLDLSLGSFDFVEKDNPEDYVGTITVWSFTEEVQHMIPYFNEVYPNIVVNFEVIPNQDEVYLNRVYNTVGSGVDEPDVFTGEAAFYRQFIDAGLWLPISGPDLADVASDTIPYIVESAVDDDGLVNALSWQATPGVIFYNRTIASAVLGADDPVSVSEYTSDIRKFYELGLKVKNEFGGAKYLVAGFNDMSHFMYNLRDEPYIVGNNFSIPSNFIDYMNIAKNMRDDGIDAGYQTWGPDWFNSMSDGSVMCYVMPTWGLHYVLRPNAEPAANNGEAEYLGDWGMAVPPASYSWGGTWIGVNRYTEKADLAYLFTRFVGTNKDFLTSWANVTGDITSNMDVNTNIAPGYSEPFLDGQNHYEVFSDESKKIDVSNNGPWDYQIENLWHNEIEKYVDGEISYDQTIQNFKSYFSDRFPDINIE